jgi:tetratricopeptide (TPR) repeat protein
LRNLSQIHQARGELDIALDCYRQALAIWTNIGNQEAAAATLGRMESLSP